MSQNGLGIECLISLQTTFNTLDNSKQNRQKEDQSSNPERVPLNSFPPVKPPLRQSAWLSLIKDLLENNQAIMPEVKVFNSAILGPKASASQDFAVKTMLRYLTKPRGGSQTVCFENMFGEGQSSKSVPLLCVQLSNDYSSLLSISVSSYTFKELRNLRMPTESWDILSREVSVLVLDLNSYDVATPSL